MSTPLKFFDRAVETCQAPGVGPLSLEGAQTGFQPITRLMSAGEQAMFLIRDQAGGDNRWEVVEVTKLNDGTFSRQAGDVEDGSEGPGALVNFDSGTQDVWIFLSADLITRAVYGKTVLVTTPAAVWTITHDMDFHPVVTCEDGSGVVLAPQQIRYASNSQVVITFASAQSGRANLR